MRSKFIPLMVFAVLTAAVAPPLSAQSNPSAEQGGWPVVIGGGMSVFNMDFPPGSGNIEEGETIWGNWARIPFVPRHLGLEAEFRNLSLNAPSSEPGLSSKTFLGGPSYTWNFSRFAVYGKGMVGYASLHFPPLGNYSHDTRTIEGAGGGAEYRLWNGVSARADYEYQWWPSLVYGRLHPKGYTFGLAYDFRTFGRQF